MKNRSEEKIESKIRWGTKYPRFFIPDSAKDYLMNLARLYIALRKIKLLGSTVRFYPTDHASLRATIMGEDVVSFSIFQRYLPGVTNMVAIKKGSYVEYANRELETLKPDAPVDIDQTLVKLARYGRDVVVRLDPSKSKLKQCWNFFNSNYSDSDIIEKEMDLSWRISDELLQTGLRDQHHGVQPGLA